MKEKLYIPTKLKVGFNLRQDTYTGKLGYVIYHDGKVWRKETGWESWRQKAGEAMNQWNPNTQKTEKITLGPDFNPLEIDNVPTEGFVLNKKAGGYSSGWNHRATYCRVYDPRGFEFEISIPNLLFILQECNAMKGKGLEGEFVYSWEGKDLVLLPVHCEDYKLSSNFTKVQAGKVSTKDLEVGCTYKTKQLENLVYVGKFNWYNYWSDRVEIKKSFIFYDKKDGFKDFTGLSSFSEKVNDTPVDNYAEMMDKFNNSNNNGTLIGYSKLPYEIKTQFRYSYRSPSDEEAMIEISPNTFEIYKITFNLEYTGNYNYKAKSYNITTNKIVTISPDGNFTIKAIPPKASVSVSKAIMDSKNFINLVIDNQKNKNKNLIVNF